MLYSEHDHGHSYVPTTAFVHVYSLPSSFSKFCCGCMQVSGAMSQAQQHMGDPTLSPTTSPTTSNSSPAQQAAVATTQRTRPSSATPSQQTVLLDPYAMLLPQQYANVLYSLAVLQYSPSSTWLQQYWGLTQGLFRHWQYAGPQKSGRSMWAGDVQQAVQSQPSQISLQVPETSQPLAVQPVSDTPLTHGPPHGPPSVPPHVLPPGWAKALRGSLRPQHLSNTLWAAAKLGCAPPADWMTAFETQLQRLVGAAGFCMIYRV